MPDLPPPGTLARVGAQPVAASPAPDPASTHDSIAPVNQELDPVTPPTPGAVQFDLLDGKRRIGWVNGGTIGFRGFADETEAAHAAWVAHRRLAERLARRHGGPPAPIDVEPVTVAREGERELILATDRPIATLLRPGVDSRAGPESFAFEIEVPLRADELTMRSIAYRIYRTLKNSGVGWARWTPGARRVDGE